MSTSGGATWTKLDQTLREVFAVTADPLCEAGSYGDPPNIKMAISTSMDAGITWNRSVFGDGKIKALAVDLKNRKTVFAGGVYLILQTGGGYYASCGRLFRSTDGGLNWGEMAASTFNSDGNCIYAITVDPGNSSKILACTPNGVYVSQDGGGSWIAPKQKIESSCIVPDQAVADKYYLGSGSGAWMTTDGGTTWQQINNGLTNLRVQCIAYDTTNKVLYAGTAGAGVFRLFLEGKPANRKPILAGRTPGTLLTVTVNTPTTFRVSASDPDGDALTYTWKVDGTTEKTGSDSTFTKTFSGPHGSLHSVTAVFADPGGLKDSTTWNFTTIMAAPQMPTLASPADGAVNQATTIVLSWSASVGATSYRLQVSSTVGFTSLVVDDSTLTVTSRQIGPLSNNSTYYWRVSATNVGGTSAYSLVRNFTTIVAAPQAPGLVSPEANAINVSLNPTLSWNASSGATKYHVQVSLTAVFASNIVDDSTITGTTKAIGPLVYGTTYFWEVRAMNAGGASGFSGSRQFRTILTNAVERLDGSIPEEFALYQNYPNPFNPSTTITFAVPKEALVTLCIYNLLGEKVAVLVSQELHAGYYRTTWNAADMPSGVYVYRLEAGTFVESRKLTLLR